MWITGRIIQKKGNLLLVRQHWSGYLYEVEMKDCRFKKDDHREVKFSHSDAAAVRWWSGTENQFKYRGAWNLESLAS